MKTASRIHRPLGFSLVEVMVALVVVSVGLLGIAKMQAVALSNTTVASSRSLAAIEASSLAAAMHENRGYWTSTAATAAPIQVLGATVNALPAGYVDCSTAGPCKPPVLAAYDLQTWATALQALLPNDQATITCSIATPPNCVVTIKWNEKSVMALNSTTAAQAQAQSSQADDTTVAINNPLYTLYVEP
jgi:type IV pilus assembly protein PilV